MTAPEPRAPTGASELRALRLLTAVLAATTLAATLGTSVVTGALEVGDAPLGYGAALALAVACPLLAGAVAPWTGARMLRALNAIAAGSFLLLLLAFLVLALPDLERPAEVPWFLTVTAGPVTAALVAGGRTLAWLALGAMTALVQAIRWLAAADAQDAIANDTFTVFASASIVLLAGQFLRVSREFDHATEAAAHAAAQRSEAEARLAASERTRLLVHDELLSTLSLAARAGSSLGAAIARQASRARRLIRELHLPVAGPGLDAAGFAALLEEVVAEAPGARFETAVRPHAVAPDPDAVEALVGAARQALANSVAHAGPGADRVVVLEHDETAVRIRVRDDGVGFDPRAVSPDRMGVSASILGRLRSLPGGTAEVSSAPGHGTQVELGWERPASPQPSAEAPPATGSILIGDGSRMRWGYPVAVLLFLIGQGALAALATLRAGEGWVAGPALLGVALGFLVLGRPRPAPPSRRRTGVVLAVAAATAALAWAPVDRDPARYGDVWFVAALGFVLLVLAMRGRPRAALLGAASVAGIVLVSVILQRNDGVDALAATTRMLAVVGIGAAFLAGIERVRSRTLALRHAELERVADAAFRTTERHELSGRSAALEALIGDLLDRLEHRDELTDATRRECAVLEGRLRDGYRAGRLAREPLVAAAAAARGRGVDVAPFDDPEARRLAEHELDAIVRWMAERLGLVTAGRFTGRVLPDGRVAAASAATDETVAEFPPVRP